MAQQRSTNVFSLRINAGTRGNSAPRNRELDIRRLGVRHEWETGPVQQPSFAKEVQHAANRRPDMQRFAQLCEARGEQNARNAWSTFIGQHTLFRIPATINSARTFVREELEAYYVNAMASFIESAYANNFNDADVIGIMDIPFVNQEDCLLGRWWNQFHLGASFLQE